MKKMNKHCCLQLNKNLGECETWNSQNMKCLLLYVHQMQSMVKILNFMVNQQEKKVKMK